MRRDRDQLLRALIAYELPIEPVLRAADPQQRAILNAYLTDATLPRRARVLEVGCGTGAVTRVLAAWPGVLAYMSLVARKPAALGGYGPK